MEDTTGGSATGVQRCSSPLFTACRCVLTLSNCMGQGNPPSCLPGEDKWMWTITLSFSGGRTLFLCSLPFPCSSGPSLKGVPSCKKTLKTSFLFQWRQTGLPNRCRAQSTQLKAEKEVLWLGVSPDSDVKRGSSQGRSLAHPLTVRL